MGADTVYAYSVYRQFDGSIRLCNGLVRTVCEAHRKFDLSRRSRSDVIDLFPDFCVSLAVGCFTTYVCVYVIQSNWFQKLLVPPQERESETVRPDWPVTLGSGPQ